MTMNSKDDKFEQALKTGLVKKLLKADLLTAAESFGYEPDAKERQQIDTATCSEEEFLQKALKIAELADDKMLAENVRQRITYAELKYPLCPAAHSTLDIFAERFYSFWEDGKMIFVRSELGDFPEWYNTAQKKAEEIFSASEMEKILMMACNKNRDQKATLLWKLVRNFIDSETIRIGYLYPDRDMARQVLYDFMDKLRELLLIREQHESSLQFGDDPEELIPYVTANIIKNLLNDNLSDALDNANALAYLHYAAQETESNITGTDAYAVLKKEFALFRDGDQCSWPNVIRKMFSDATMVEILIRYRFTHGLIAVNCALAFRHAASQGKFELETWEEDAIVLNGLILTQMGYIKSSGFQDAAIKEQFVRDINLFNETSKKTSSKKTTSFFQFQRQFDVERSQLEENLKKSAYHINQWIEGQQQIIKGLEKEIVLLESQSLNSEGSFFKKMITSGGNKASHEKKQVLLDELDENRAMLNDLSEVSSMHTETKRFLRKMARFFR